MCSTRGEVEEQEYDKEENAPSLQVSRSLTLRHPGGFYVLQSAGGAVLRALCMVSSSFFVGVVCYVSGRQRDRCASH